MPGSNQTYTLTFSDNVKSDIVVQPLGTNTGSTSLTFVGKGLADYGELVQENLLHLLENFAKTSAPSNPIEGQLWYDTTSGKNLKIWNGTTWRLVNDPQASTTEVSIRKVDVVSVVNTTLSGLQTIDGVVLIADDRVLLINQTAPAENGIWQAKSGSWIRPDDFAAWDQIVGIEVYVTRGTVHAGDGYQNTNAEGGVLNVTTITWANETSKPTTVAIGDGAARSITGTTNFVVALGQSAARSVTSANGLIAIGEQSLRNTNTGGDNIGIGRQAGLSITNGTLNIAIGTNALDAVTTGARNIAIGANALGALATAGSDNIAIGNNALLVNVSGTQSVAIGTNALTAATGGPNTAVGYQTLFSNVAGTHNCAFGWQALNLNVSGNDNTAVGYRAGQNTTGSLNVAFGSDALLTNGAGSSNIAIGYQALTAMSNASDNTAIGKGALAANLTGGSNIAIGSNALSATTITTDNIAIGVNSMVAAASGGSNIAIGNLALNANLAGNQNVAIGHRVMELNQSGSQNVAIGYRAMTTSVTASNAVAIGYQANDTASVGISSIAIGTDVDATALASMATGRFANSTIIGKWSHSTDRFSINGDAQTAMYVLRGTTTNATPVVLTTDGGAPISTNQINVPNDGTVYFMIQVIARRTDADNESAAYRYEGCADNNAATTALVGTVSETVVAEDTAAWTVVTTADDSNDVLNVTVTGQAAKTIRWVAFVRTVEVIG